MKTTENFGLKKPELNDYVNVQDLNDNMDVIDTNLKANKDAVNLLNHTTPVTLTASGWSGEAAPYTQTVPVEGATEEMEAILVSALAFGADLDTQKAYVKAFGIISSGTASLGDGTATFRVYKKPTADCVVGLKGV